MKIVYNIQRKFWQLSWRFFGKLKNYSGNKFIRINKKMIDKGFL